MNSGMKPLSAKTKVQLPGCDLHGPGCRLRATGLSRLQNAAWLESIGEKPGSWADPGWSPNTCHQIQADLEEVEMSIGLTECDGEPLKRLYRSQYGETCEVVQELKSSRAEREWKGYRRLPDGRAGPSPESISTPSKRAEYCRKFGFAEM